MQFLTNRKQATGLGSAKGGTHHHWSMQVSGLALAILVPLFVFTFGRALGAPYAEVIAYYQRPFPSIVAALTLVVGLLHFKSGAQIMIEDYVHGVAGKLAILGVTFLSYALAALAVFSLAKIAFTT